VSEGGQFLLSLDIRYSAATLIEMLREDSPSEPVAPNETNGWTTRILSTTIESLAVLDLCPRDLSPRTLYNWYLEAKKAGVFSNTPPFSAYTA